MPVGIEVYDSSGVLLLDLTSKVCHVIGSVDTGTSDGSISVAWPAGRQPFFVQVPLVDVYKLGKKPGVTITPGGLSWAFLFPGGNGFYAANCRIYYGFY